MRRLWVQFSLASAGLIVGVTILMFLASAVLITATSMVSSDGPAPVSSSEELAPEAIDENDKLPSQLLFGIGLTGVVSAIAGILAGVVISRKLSAPITQLATATQIIGSGNLSYRVDIRGSQEIVDLGEAFNQMASGLQRAEIIRRNLIADVSHELRTPLTVLKGQLRSALDRVLAFDEEAIANLYEQTDHLISLVNDLHELAQAEAKQLPLNKVPIDISLVLHETIQTFQSLAEEKQITLQSDIKEPLCVLMVDAARMRQVLHNLLGNALQFTPREGMVTVSALEQNHELCITVQDNGIGIPPKHIDHIFDRFYRVDVSRSRATGGSGLGLAVARAIIEAHDGQLHARSPGINQGTEFIITLSTL